MSISVWLQHCELHKLKLIKKFPQQSHSDRRNDRKKKISLKQQDFISGKRNFLSASVEMILHSDSTVASKDKQV